VHSGCLPTRRGRGHGPSRPPLDPPVLVTAGQSVVPASTTRRRRPGLDCGNSSLDSLSTASRRSRRLYLLDTADGKGATHGTITAVYQKAEVLGEPVAPPLSAETTGCQENRSLCRQQGNIRILPADTYRMDCCYCSGVIFTNSQLS